MLPALLSFSGFRQLLEINLVAPWLLARQTLPHLRRVCGPITYTHTRERVVLLHSIKQPSSLISFGSSVRADQRQHHQHRIIIRLLRAAGQRRLLRDQSWTDRHVARPGH